VTDLKHSPWAAIHTIAIVSSRVLHWHVVKIILKYVKTLSLIKTM